MRREGQGSENSEHVVVRTHLIIVQKQLTAKAFVIEVVGEIAHRPFEVVALVDDVTGKVFFETHCYAPLDVKKPFEVIANVKIDKLANDRVCGFVFN